MQTKQRGHSDRRSLHSENEEPLSSPGGSSLHDCCPILLAKGLSSYLLMFQPKCGEILLLGISIDLAETGSFYFSKKLEKNKEKTNSKLTGNNNKTITFLASFRCSHLRYKITPCKLMWPSMIWSSGIPRGGRTVVRAPMRIKTHVV